MILVNLNSAKFVYAICVGTVFEKTKIIATHLFPIPTNRENINKKPMKSNLSKLVLILFLLVGFQLTSTAQEYSIKVRIDGLTSGQLLLGYHLGDKKYVQDTSLISANGTALFEGKEKLKSGIYLVILPSMNYFEILVGDQNQKFELTTQQNDLLGSLNFVNSPENTAFANYQRYMVEKQTSIKALQDKMKENADDTRLAKTIKDEIDAIDREVKSNWVKVINENPNTLLANIIKAMKPLETPEFHVSPNHANPDSVRWAKAYHFNRNHFFDGITFSDEGLIRTPILEGRLNMYFDKVLIPIPDTISKEADRVIEMSKVNDEMYQYVLSFLFNKYQTSNIMGMDAVFVHLAEKYYLSGQVSWVDTKVMGKIEERVNALKPNLIGAKAANLILPDNKGVTQNLHQIAAPVSVVYFWDPTCSHCKKVTPELLKLYNEYKDKGFVVYAVYTQGDQPKWFEYIEQNKLNWINVWDPKMNSNFRNNYDIYSTPVIYILDKDKKIIAKRIDPEVVKEILDRELNTGKEEVEKKN